MNVIDNTPDGVGIVLSAKEYEWLLSAIIFYGHSNSHTLVMGVCIEGWNEIYKSPEVQAYKEKIGL